MILALAQAVESFIYWDGKDERGVSRRERLIQVTKSGGKVDQRNLLPDRKPPEVGWRAWRTFWDLSSGRGSNGWGPEPLSMQEIQAWIQLTGNKLKPWEVAAVRRMDRVFLEDHYKKIKK